MFSAAMPVRTPESRAVNDPATLWSKMPEAAIAFACRSAIAVSCGSVLTADKPFACRYREIISAMSSACASVEVIATTAPSKTALITGSPNVPCNEAAIIGAGCGGYWAWRRARIVAAALNQHKQSGIERGNVPLFRRNIVNVPVNERGGPIQFHLTLREAHTY